MMIVVLSLWRPAYMCFVQRGCTTLVLVPGVGSSAFAVMRHPLQELSGSLSGWEYTKHVASGSSSVLDDGSPKKLHDFVPMWPNYAFRFTLAGGADSLGPPSGRVLG